MKWRLRTFFITIRFVPLWVLLWDDNFYKYIISSFYFHCCAKIVQYVIIGSKTRLMTHQWYITIAYFVLITFTFLRNFSSNSICARTPGHSIDFIDSNDNEQTKVKTRKNEKYVNCLGNFFSKKMYMLPCAFIAI